MFGLRNVSSVITAAGSSAPLSCLLWLIAEQTAVVQLLIDVLELALVWDRVGNFGSFVPVIISASISISGWDGSVVSCLESSVP